MKDLSQIMFGIFKPYIKEDRWAEFVQSFRNTEEWNKKPLSEMQVERRPTTGEVLKITFKFKDGYGCYVFEPWRRISDWSPDSEDARRIERLLRDAEQVGDADGVGKSVKMPPSLTSADKPITRGLAYA